MKLKPTADEAAAAEARKKTAEPWSRRRFIKLVTAAAIALFGVSYPVISKAQAPDRPRNLFVIVIDDMSADIGALGSAGAVTPFLDAFAARGVNFLYAMTPNPYCAGARAALMSGCSPWVTGVYATGMDFPKRSTISPDEKCGPMKQTLLHRYFLKKGFKTIGTGKVTHSGWRGNDFGKDRCDLDLTGWSEFNNCNSGDCLAPIEKNDDGIVWGIGPKEGELGDEERADWAIEHVINQPQPQPFALFFGIKKPHTPWYPSAEDLAEHPELVWPVGIHPADRRPDVTFETSIDLSDEGPEAVKSAKRYGDQDGIGTKSKPGIIVQDKVREEQQYYRASATGADKTFGKLIAALDASAHADNTLVVVFSDNGFQFFEHMASRKFTLWEQSCRVPCMIAGPGVTPGNCATPFSTIDLYATICDVFFDEMPTQAELGRFPLPSVSRKSWLSSPTTPRENAVVTTWMQDLGAEADFRDNPNGIYFSVRTNDWRLIQYPGGGRGLYRHSGPNGDPDPHEWNNLLDRPTPELIAIADDLTKHFPPQSQWAPPAERSAVDVD